jgi:hypothetical protein
MQTNCGGFTFPNLNTINWTQENVDTLCSLSTKRKLNWLHKKRTKLKKAYSENSMTLGHLIFEGQIINGYDMNTQQIRQMNSLLLFFTNDKEIEALSSIVPPYIKLKVLKCCNLYLVDIPYQCIELFLLLVPKKKTVMIGVNGHSPITEKLEYYQICRWSVTNCFY